MTPQQLKTMKLALDALKAMAEDLGYFTEEVPAITALEEVLKEHAMQEVQRLGQEIEQEPVIGKWSLREVYFDEDGEPTMHRSPPQRTEQEPAGWEVGVVDGVVTRRLAPPQRKPLTFSKLCDIEYEITHKYGDFSILRFARAIEAAHGIKENT